MSILSEFKTAELQRVLPMCVEASLIPDGIGQTALFYAVQRTVDSEATAVAERLISDAGIDPLRKDFGGQSPLFYAVAGGNLETVRTLLTKYKSQANETDNLLQTPLFYAGREGRTEMTQLLLDFKADANHVDRNGQTALFYAAREGRKNVIDLLLSQGASADHVDAMGRKPSYFARLALHNEIAEYLDSMCEVCVGESRKRYRLVFVTPEGGQQTPSVEQLEYMESRYPEICVWTKTGPIASGVAVPISVVGSEKPTIARTSVPGILKKKPAPAPVPVWITVARQMVTEIFKREDAWIFLRPVDPLRDMCADYFSVIKEPMDFGTIRKKMSKYANKAEFLADVDLVFTNCKTFNKPGTLPEVLGGRVETFWKDLVDRYSFLQLPDSVSSP
jgi:hypothetical protein